MMPPHRVYIEPFLGSGALLRLKRPAEINVGVDLDEQAVEEFRREALSSKLASEYRSTISPILTISAAARRASSLPARLKIGGAPSLILARGSALDFLRAYKFRGDELIYLDPPYLESVRRSARPIYRCEFSTAEEHAELLAIVLGLPCRCMISGYHSRLYDQTLRGWRRAEFQTVNRAGGRTRECVWMNYAQPLELHDYSFLGRNFRERERIKRKRERFKGKLRRMPDLERLAILSAIAELRDVDARRL